MLAHPHYLRGDFVPRRASADLRLQNKWINAKLRSLDPYTPDQSPRLPDTPFWLVQGRRRKRRTVRQFMKEGFITWKAFMTSVSERLGVGNTAVQMRYQRNQFQVRRITFSKRTILVHESEVDAVVSAWQGSRASRIGVCHGPAGERHEYAGGFPKEAPLTVASDP